MQAHLKEFNPKTAEQRKTLLQTRGNNPQQVCRMEEKPDKSNLTHAHRSQAVMLRVTKLQAMQPVKFSGNTADFPIFRRIRDNLMDGLLSDAQRIEFSPKFVTGEAYEVVQRSAGCSYNDIVAILEKRYG